VNDSELRADASGRADLLGGLLARRNPNWALGIDADTVRAGTIADAFGQACGATDEHTYGLALVDHGIQAGRRAYGLAPLGPDETLDAPHRRPGGRRTEVAGAVNIIQEALARVAAGTSTLEDSLVLGNEIDRLGAEVTRLRAVEDRLGEVMVASHVTAASGKRMPVLAWLTQTNSHVREAVTLTDNHVDSALALARSGRHRRPRRTSLRLASAR